eukprot:15469359-Alexandrium_andersonii.AAC.1
MPGGDCPPTLGRRFYTATYRCAAEARKRSAIHECFASSPSICTGWAWPHDTGPSCLSGHFPGVDWLPLISR